MKFVNRIMDLFRVQKLFRVGRDLFRVQFRVKTIIYGKEINLGCTLFRVFFVLGCISYLEQLYYRPK